MTSVFIGIYCGLAILQLLDILCLMFFDRHLFRSKYSSEPSWTNIFLRMKEK